MQNLLNDILSSNKKIAIAITGGGTEIIGELLRHGGASNTIVEAVVPYAQSSFDNYTKGKPDKYCSLDAARDLAMAAFNRLVKFNVGNQSQLIGLGATSSLAKNNERAGREHHAFVAVQTEEFTRVYDIDLSISRTREEEESYVAYQILTILATACESAEKYNGKYEETIGDKNFLEIVTGKSKAINLLNKNENLENRIIFSGSFNPMHEQHINIAKFVSDLKNQKIDLEICVHNVDKPSLNYHSFNERKKSILQNCDEWTGDIFFTALPTFLEKSCYFKNATFIVGWDTFIRILDPKYADLNKVYEAFKENNSRFLVFHRITDGINSNSLTCNFPKEIMERTEIIDSLPASDLSSRFLRNK